MASRRGPATKGRVAYIALRRLHIKRLNTDDEYVTSTPDTPHQQSVPASAQTTPRGTEPSATQRARRSARNGLLAGIGCYAIWGCIPIFFNAIGRAGPVEILAHRVVWSLVFCVIILVLSRRWSRFTATLRNGRALRTLAVATVLILCNWLVYVYAVTSGHVLDASLGYYINPLVTVILAVLVQKERVQPLTWIALGSGAGAVIVLTVGMGTLPWVSLVLAFSFGFYGLLKSRIGTSVDSLTSLSVETLLAAPFALGFLIWLTAIGQSTFGTGGSLHTVLLICSGIITALPLLFFGYSAQHLPLSTLGMLQYLGPTIQFIIALAVFNEPMPPARWIGFVLVWVAVVLAAVSAARHSRMVNNR